ncbi:MAG TPA: hypothetical protein VH500_12300 [Nitrososphaeraceae archaeon]|jgi:hypothetical protein
MTPSPSSSVIKKTGIQNRRKVSEGTPGKYDSILDELQKIGDYEDNRMDFSRYNTLEEHMQLLDENNCYRNRSKINHKLAPNV